MKAATKEKPVQADAAKKRPGQFALAWKRFCRNKAAVVSLIIVLIIVLAAIFADFITPYDYDTQNLMEIKQYPSLKHLMGTDNFGRDMFTRILRGGRISLLVALMTVCISTAVSLILGSLAGYFGGMVDTVIMRIADIFISIPGLVLSMCMSAALGTGLVNTAIAISVSSIWPMTRQLRASIMTIKGSEYLEASKAFGARDWYVIFHHVIPHAIAPLIVQVAMTMGNSITQIATLSFLGLGVQPPTPEWGNMLAAGKEFITSFWPMMIWPGLMVAICLLCFNLIGDGLRDALDPRMKR